MTLRLCTLRSLSASNEPKPTMAELLAELREINKLEPPEIELPPRQDRPNPILEKLK